MTTPALMVLGTGSHVGKSMITAALCRIFSQAGYRVAPFKAQNMSLNSAATVEGLEIGRAQALQAEAAGVPASVHMNPVLLKPTGNTTSQVIVRGKIWRQVTAADYFHFRTEELAPIVRESYELLAAQHDLIILEGAGSPAEINLKDRDIVNLRMAQIAKARCVLVGDIDRGGVFASLLGTLELLDPAERNLINGFIVNKFRGSLDLLWPGIRMIEQRMGKPCLGVIPYLEDFSLDEEDSVALTEATRPWNADSRIADSSIEDSSPLRRVRIGVIRFPSISNFTDFDPLFAEPSVQVRFCRTAEELAASDLIILPGTKQTIADLRWMRVQGMDRVLQNPAARRLIFGICGGMQMLGASVEDPHAVEGGGSEEALALLPIRTTLTQEKTTVEAEGALVQPEIFGQRVTSIMLRGYEIHVGQTSYLDGSPGFARIIRAGAAEQVILDGCVSRDGRVIGTYLHGLFHEDAFRHSLLAAVRGACGLDQPPLLLPWKALRERQFNRLAVAVAAALDLRTMLSWVRMPWPAQRDHGEPCASKA